MRIASRSCLAPAALALGVLFLDCGDGAVRPDEVTEWNQIMLQSALAAVPPTSPFVMSRVGAIVQASVFDAVNGVERRYAPIHVEPAADRGASQRAAAVQAAYGALVRIYPDQKSALDQKLAASLEGIASGPGADHSQSIARGIAWGQEVADAIWAWRSTDGFTTPPPPYLGGHEVGQWRRTPPAFLPGAVPQFATMTPWVIKSPSQFRPTGPPALDSARYTTDFNETKAMGGVTSAAGTADQTLAARFWNASTATYYWDTIAVSLGASHHYTLSDKARMLAVLNVAMADAAIACWDAKYTYSFWRPVTAIPLAASDGNPQTVEDTAWLPLLITPAFPEYPSAHSALSGAAAEVLSSDFGNDRSFSVGSDVMVGVVRSFTSFSGALDEVKDARIDAGIHFRSACDDGQVMGIAVADYVIAHAARPLPGHRVEQVRH